MYNKFNVKPLWEVSKTLSAVAQGFQSADIVITNAKLINVCTKEILPNIDVAISCGRIALVGDAKHCIGEKTQVIDAKEQYIAPGFLDGHIHVESSMLSVSEYARSVVPHGTVGIYMDPHEICNVLGLDGVKYMIEDGKRTPEEQVEVINDIDSNGDWIIEGTYRESCHCLFNMSDKIIFLDTPLWKRRYRILLRYIKQQLLIEKCHYKSNLKMLKKMYKWTREFENNRAKFEKMLHQYSNKLITVKNVKEIFVDSIFSLFTT